jgi:hypothetical protein
MPWPILPMFCEMADFLVFGHLGHLVT